MSDSFTGKNNKVKVMYVRANREESPSSKPPYNSHNNRDISKHSKVRAPKAPDTNKSQRSVDKFAWQIKSQQESETAYQHILSDKPRIDPEQLRRQRNEESRVYGENACRALFNNRPNSIVRAYFTQEVTPRFRETLRWLAANRKAYHVVEPKELQKISGSEHHGGVCFLIKKRQSLSVEHYLESANPERDCLIAIEDVGNPHNLGGIMRSAAHYGVGAILTQHPDMLESGAAIRTAEGGAEYLQAIHFTTFDNALHQLQQAGYTIVTTSSHQGEPLSQVALPSKIVFVLGQEADGLSDTLLQQGDKCIAIDGTGHVESLNVSVASAILLATWWQQQQTS